MPKLKDKRHEEMCQQYIIDFNGARAAHEAGFGKNRKVARVWASKLLTKAFIRKRILELLEARSKRTEITQDRVLQEMAILGFSDFRDYGRIKESGEVEFHPFSKIKGGKTRAIESMKQVDSAHGRSISMKLHGKVRPLELLGKHTGLFVDTHNINLTGDIQVISAVPRSKKKEKKGQ